MPWRTHPVFGRHYELRLRKPGQIQCIDFKSKADADAYYAKVQVQKQKDREAIRQELQREQKLIRFHQLVDQIEEETNICRGLIRRNNRWHEVKGLRVPLTAEESAHIKRIKRHAGRFQLPANWPVTHESRRGLETPINRGKPKTFLQTELTDSNLQQSSMKNPQQTPAVSPSYSTPLAQRDTSLEREVGEPDQQKQSKPSGEPGESIERSEYSSKEQTKTFLQNELTDSILQQDLPTPDHIRVHPDAWKEFGELMSWTRDEALDFLSIDSMQYKCVMQSVEALRKQLYQPDDSALERLLCESIITSHIESERCGFKLYSLPETNEAEPIARHRMRVQDRAHSRLLRSMQMLERMRIRKLDQALKLRKHRPANYDKDDYLQVDGEAIFARQLAVEFEQRVERQMAHDWCQNEIRERRAELKEEQQKAEEEAAKAEAIDRGTDVPAPVKPNTPDPAVTEEEAKRKASLSQIDKLYKEYLARKDRGELNNQADGAPGSQ